VGVNSLQTIYIAYFRAQATTAMYENVYVWVYVGVSVSGL